VPANDADDIHPQKDVAESTHSLYGPFAEKVELNCLRRMGPRPHGDDDFSLRAHLLCAYEGKPENAEDDDGQPGADHQQGKHRRPAFTLTRLRWRLDDLSVFLGCHSVLAPRSAGHRTADAKATHGEE